MAHECSCQQTLKVCEMLFTTVKELLKDSCDDCLKSDVNAMFDDTAPDHAHVAWRCTVPAAGSLPIWARVRGHRGITRLPRNKDPDLAALLRQIRVQNSISLVLEAPARTSLTSSIGSAPTRSTSLQLSSAARDCDPRWYMRSFSTCGRQAPDPTSDPPSTRTAP
eukprot:2036738-Pyramimonas_sp.AAC.1